MNQTMDTNQLKWNLCSVTVIFSSLPRVMVNASVLTNPAVYNNPSESLCVSFVNHFVNHYYFDSNIPTYVIFVKAVGKTLETPLHTMQSSLTALTTSIINTCVHNSLTDSIKTKHCYLCEERIYD